MTDRSQFDVILLGYRNDIAQARTLEFLDHVPPALGTLHLDRAAQLPLRLFAGLDREQAEGLRAGLETCGAQVMLAAVGTTEPPQVDARAPGAASAARQTLPWRSLALVIVVACAAAAYWRRPPEPAARLRPLPPRVTAPLSAQDSVAEPEPAQSNEEAVALAEARDFPQAVARLQDALRRAPDNLLLTRNLQTVLLNWGIADLSAGRSEDATQHLHAAAELGERVEVLRALGIAQLHEGDYPAAATALERAQELTPNDPDTLVALAEVYLKQDQRPQALDLLQRAHEAGARSAELDKKIRMLSREVDAEWDFVETESPHFRVSFADSEDTHAVRFVLATLEDAYFTVGGKFDHYPDTRAPVVLYTQQDFHAVTQTPDWAGAAFDGRIKLPVRGLDADNVQLPRVVRHEYAHSLVTELSNGRAPVWLNEGLAVWAEESQDGERQAWAEQKIAGQELFTLAQLNSSFVNLPAASAEVAYAQSYLAVRALIDQYGARKIATFLSNIGRTRSLNEAFAATYPGDLAGFEERWLHGLTG